MSYPEARYLGDGGTTSATVRLATVDPELDGAATAASYLATGVSTVTSWISQALRPSQASDRTRA